MELPKELQPRPLSRATFVDHARGLLDRAADSNDLRLLVVVGLAGEADSCHTCDQATLAYFAGVALSLLANCCDLDGNGEGAARARMAMAVIGQQVNSHVSTATLGPA